MMAEFAVEIPSHALRGPCPGVAFAKGKDWVELDRWVANATDLEIMRIDHDDAQPVPRNHLLATCSRYAGPPQGTTSLEHLRATAAVIAVFQNQGLIDLKFGKSEETALCVAGAQGNIVMAERLLQAGASTLPSVILSYPHPGQFAFTGFFIVSARDGERR